MKANTKKLVITAMFAAIAFAIVAFIRIPVVQFLKYEPKDVIITIGGFILGPFASFLISIVVSLVEMLTISDTGLIGCIMNVLSTCAFACTAALVYKCRRTQMTAILGLFLGTLAMIVVMVLWNYLITPIYMGLPREEVAEMLVPVFLPFNALKAGLNSAITMIVYKPLTLILCKTKLLETRSGNPSQSKAGIYIFAIMLLATCVVSLLVIRGLI